tara:strand:+ start:31087 stop:32127 length:1041 start_codon:yes stop_codon:yes gene_type:complete
MVSFGGYLLPIYYTSIIKEHSAVRKNAGLFDVSHMGEFIVSGNDSSTFIQKLTVNDVSSLSPGQAQYSAMCYENGGLVDDILIFKREKSYLIVVNAANIVKNLNWLNSHIDGQVSINNISEEIELIALQGPKAREILQPLIDIDLMDLSYFHFLDGNIIGHKAMISRTGYTGELGYEIYIDPKYVINIWDAILEYGHKYGIEPAGLGCRDTLRMEMKYVLYGVDIDKNANPIEAGLGWVVKFNKGEFLGKKALINAKKNLLRKFVCIEMMEQAIPRNGCRILVDNEVVGHITSGTMSPSLQIGMGMGYVNMPFTKKGTLLKIDIRGKEVPAMVIKGPFYKEGSLLS